MIETAVYKTGEREGKNLLTTVIKRHKVRSNGYDTRESRPIRKTPLLPKRTPLYLKRRGRDFPLEGIFMKRGKSYEWIPLWIDKWLMGSTRFELDPAERSVFLDLMVLAAKDDGYIRANQSMGYPIEYLARILNVSIELLTSSISKCIKYEKIKDIGNGAYYLVNWESYRLSPRHKKRLMSQNNDIASQKNDPFSVSVSVSKSLFLEEEKKEGDKGEEGKSALITKEELGQILKRGHEFIVNEENESKIEMGKNLIIPLSFITSAEKELTRIFSEGGHSELLNDIQFFKYLIALCWEFRDIENQEDEIKKKFAHWIKNPLKQKSNICLQFRNWFSNARKFEAERQRERMVGKNTPKDK